MTVRHPNNELFFYYCKNWGDMFDKVISDCFLLIHIFELNPMYRTTVLITDGWQKVQILHTEIVSSRSNIFIFFYKLINISLRYMYGKIVYQFSEIFLLALLLYILPQYIFLHDLRHTFPKEKLYSLLLMMCYQG